MKKLALILLLVLTAIPCFAFSTTTAFAEDGKHTVSFYVDGELHEQYLVSDGGFSDIPVTPVKDGEIFIEWQENGSTFYFYNPITEDKTINAVFESLAVVYTVDFVVDGNIVNTQKVLEGQTVIAPTTVELPEGKILVGWENADDLQTVSSNMTVNAILADKEYTVTIYGLDDIVVDEITVVHGENAILPNYADYSTEYYTATGYSSTPTAVTENTSVFVLYEKVSFTVEFKVLGSTYLEKSVEYLDTVQLPASPVRAGYIFTGWLLDGVPFDFKTEITEDISLSAEFTKIEKKKYEVTFYNFDGSQYGGTQLVEEGKSAILPGKPYYEGYEFEGWAQDFSCITENLKVYPIFKAKTYIVTFVDANGELSTQTVRHGQSAIEPDRSEIFEPVGKFFAGWSHNFKKVTSELTITAQYKPLTFVVMFFNGTKRVGATQYIAYGESATPPVLAEKVGYDFKGWSNGEEIGNFYESVTEELVLFAVYEAKTFNINYYEKGTLLKTETAVYGENAELYLYEKKGFVFEGWFLDAEFNEYYDFTNIVDKNLDLYAKWEQAPEVVYTVTFIVDGEIYGQPQNVVENGSAIAPANPFKEGYTFIGWDGSYEKVKNNLVLNAVFKINMYRVTFIYCDAFGDDKIEVQEIPYGDPASEPNVYEKIGHKFDGWDTPFDEITKDIIVKAIYTPNTYTVTFYDGDNVISQQSVQFGKRPSIVSTPKKEGNAFNYWVLKDGSLFSYDWLVENDVQVYARWKKLSYSVYYYINGELFIEHSVVFGEELPQSPEPNLEYDEIFSGWSEKPFTMPAKPIVVVGTINKLPRYTLTYYINGNIYYSEELLEGELVFIPDDPILAENERFSGWGNIPEYMPDGDVRIDGYITTIETRKNAIIVEVFDATDYSVGVSITVKGQVNFAGILGSLYFGDNQLTNTEFFGEGFASNYEDGVNFTWSQGENLTEEKTIAIMYFAKDGFDNLSISLSVYEFLEITESGDIQSVEYVVDYILE